MTKDRSLQADRRQPTGGRGRRRSLPRPFGRGGLALLAALGAGLLAASTAACVEPPQPLLVAPILSGTDLCQLGADAGAAPLSSDEWASYCLRSGRSAAAIVESRLAEFGPAVSPNGRFEVGYTLPVPLLKLLSRDAAGWAVDPRAVDRIALTISETNRPVVLYLFSTHFAAGAPIEEELFADSENVAVSPAGPLPRDRYYGTDIYPWTSASTDNGITRARQAVIDRVLDALCRLPPADRRKIRGVTLLGELHHLHPDFERSMGVGGPYIVSDYSDASVRGFREFLAARFGTVEALNRLTGESYRSFAEVDPPSKDIRTQPLGRFSEHIDSFAHGRLALLGWAFDPAKPGEPVWISIFRNGERIARVPARYGRQDVLEAKPSFGTANVGWRFDLDFTGLPPGIHRLDFLAEGADGALSSLGSRRVVIAARDRLSATEMPGGPSPRAVEAPGLQSHLDQPADLATYYYNPLVPLWHEFRNDQIVRYLVHFERQVRASCLRDADLYTHQIAPFTNPGWDTTKFAVDASLRAAGGLELGISLYGEPTYGASFFDWLAGSGRTRYGITEFHPLRPMAPDEARAMLEQHRQRGARFVSFFLDARPPSARSESALNIFGIDPGNPHFGSDRLYATLRALVNE